MSLVKEAAKGTLAVSTLGASVAAEKPIKTGMGAVGTCVHIGITQAPRCAHCGRDDVELVTFAPLDNDKRDFVVEPDPVCIDCAADMPRA
jgi:hypothetical protein